MTSSSMREGLDFEEKPMKIDEKPPCLDGELPAIEEKVVLVKKEPLLTKPELLMVTKDLSSFAEDSQACNEAQIARQDEAHPSIEAMDIDIIHEDGGPQEQTTTQLQAHSSIEPMYIDATIHEDEGPQEQPDYHDSLFLSPDPDVEEVQLDQHRNFTQFHNSRSPSVEEIFNGWNHPLNVNDKSDGDDDDVIIVKESDTSQCARNRWASNRILPHHKTNQSDAPPIKEEADTATSQQPKRGNMEAVQAQLLRSFRKRKAPEPDMTHRRGGRPGERINMSQIGINTTFLDARSQLPEENSWMEGSENDGSSEEFENNEKKRASILKRQEKNGNLPNRDKFELMRIESRIQDYHKRREFVDHDSDWERDGQPDMTLDDGEKADGQSYREGSKEFSEMLQMDIDGQAGGKSKKRARKNKEDKPRRKIARTAREYDALERERAREKAPKKKNRSSGPKGMSGKKRMRTGTRDQVTKKKVNGRVVATKGKNMRQARMMNSWPNNRDTVLEEFLENMVPHDAIADSLAHGNVDPDPEIHETNKKKQFEALIRSVPNNYDTHKSIAKNGDLVRASRRFGFGKVKALDGKWVLKGIKSPLYHHQLLGADFMVSRELSENRPKGGINCDAMGLGKTVETLACMVGHPPTKDDRKAGHRTTLIVLPSSAILQWMAEIETHVESGFFDGVMHYKKSKDIPADVLKKCDVILTSYSDVMSSFPFPNTEEMSSMAANGGYNAWLERNKDRIGVLHQIDFYRIILDEAHIIKNWKSRTSFACQNLKGRYRWALTGTPIQNKLEEFYPYFRFLRADFAGDFTSFKKYICDPASEESNQRIQVMLSICMQRRTMKDTILGRPIVKLPDPHPETKFINFTKQERALYRIIEGRFRDGINRHFKEGTAQKNYAVFLVQLLRLRQCVAHPLLLEQTIRDIFTIEDVGLLKSELRRYGGNKAPLYEQISQWVAQSAEERAAAQEQGEATLPLGEKAPFGQSTLGTFFKMGPFLKTLNEKDMVDRVVCHLCGDILREAQIIDCTHVFCKLCLQNYMHAEIARNEESDHVACPKCDKVFFDFKNYKDAELLDDDDDDLGRASSADDSQGSRGRSAKKGKKEVYGAPKIPGAEWLNMIIQKKAELLPSAKLIALKAQILKWTSEAPDDKILVFTQFRPMARIVGLLCENEGWKHLYFTGDMSTIQRHESVLKFHKDPSVKIMIAGLKCGGVSLNLTCANRCISLDLWWNHSVEQQAFGRIFRIGQHKETWLTRLVVHNSVDGRLLGMQAHKVRTIDRAMQDTGAVVKPLDIEDLASLFGHLRENEDGVIQVEADYEDSDDEAVTQ